MDRQVTMQSNGSSYTRYYYSMVMNLLFNKQNNDH